MRKLWTLVKLDFRALLRAFSLGSGKKRAAGGVGALAFLGGLALYMSGVYSMAMSAALAAAGLLDLLVPLMSALACVMALMLTLTSASGFVFGGRDMDLMLSLPVSAFSVMLGKILALYLENFFFCALWLLPTGTAYLLRGGPGGAGFAVRLVACTLFLPLLPTLLALVGGWLVAWASARMRHKSLVASILSFGLMAVVLVGALQINRLGALVLQNPEALRRLLDTWLLPLGLMTRACAGNAAALLGLAGVSLVPFLGVTWLMSTRYKAILSGLSSRVVRNDYRLSARSDARAAGRFAALFRRECSRYFGTTIYLFNTGFGVLMLVGCSVYALIARDKLRFYLTMLGGEGTTLALAAAFLGFSLSTVCTTDVSISIEGRTLWILKAAPIPARMIFGAKAALNILLGAGAALVSVPMLSAALQLPVSGALCLAAMGVVLSVFVALFGLAVNLLLPKLDALNDTVVVKQSAAAVVGILGGMAAVGGAAALYAFAGGERLGAQSYVLVCTGVLCVLSALLWRWLCTRGAALLRKL